MKTKFYYLVILAILFSAVLSACGPGQLLGPTLTPTPTNTATQSPTFTPTITFTPTSTPTFAPTDTPAPACMPINGEWKSNETSKPWGPILTFTIRDCKIVSLQIWTYPVPGELMPWSGTTDIVISEDQFSHDVVTETGTFTIQGAFDSPTSGHGSFFFQKGFSVFGTILTKDVSIPWTASQ
jgi:hypothetical protein